jgi:hypothetical protein
VTDMPSRLGTVTVVGLTELGGRHNRTSVSTDHLSSRVRGSGDVTKEHLMADWVFRALQRTRRPRMNVIRRSDTGRGESQYGEQQLAATASCGECNNGWMADLDNKASRLLKPLVRGTGDVRLDRDA